jgi:hypothetical protein
MHYRCRPLVRINWGVTNEAFERARECMSNVQYFHVEAMRSNEPVFTLLEKAAIPNLRALRIDIRLDDQTAVAVANTLRNNPQVEQVQVQLHLQGTSEQTTSSVFDALSSLPLTALRLTFWSRLSQRWIERVCVLLQQKRDTLVSFEVDSLTNDECLVNSIVSKGLHGLRRLKLLRFPCRPLDKLRIQDLCKAMESMPHLATLRVCVISATAMTAFFRSSFRPITSLEFFDTKTVARAHFIELLNALKKNTRLRSLKLRDHQFQHVIDTGLAEEGFLTKVTEFYPIEDPRIFESVLNRNKARHTACKRSCVALIAVRRNRGVMKWTPGDIVRMIAMWLWDTRNQSVWDSELMIK